MHNILFTFPGNEDLGRKLVATSRMTEGKFFMRKFPDGESYLRLDTDVRENKIYILQSLDRPDVKILPLLFLCRQLKENKAKSVTLIAPYLPYLRQDKAFNPGEIITNKFFAELISGYIDELITIDPHLHRINTLNEIYTAKAISLSSASMIAKYVREKINDPVFVGPDEESRQWVGAVAKLANAPFIVLRKIRSGDKKVSIEVPEIGNYRNHTVVLVDDIISTAHTMIETIRHLKEQGDNKIISIGVHGVFAGSAYEDLKKAGATEILTTNTIFHSSNQIDISGLIAQQLK